MRFLTIIFFTVTSFSLLYGQRQGTDVELLKGEKWWAIGLQETAGYTPFAVKGLSAGDSARGNILLSSEGRYVYSSSPLDISMSGTAINIIGEDRVEVYKNGKTLREAYLSCCHTFFPPETNSSAVDMLLEPILGIYGGGTGVVTQDKIAEFARRMDEGGRSNISIGPGWQGSEELLQFDPTTFPRPEEFIEELHSKGFKVYLTVTPLVPSYGTLLVEGENNGYFIVDENGSPKLFRMPEGYCVCYDMSKEGVVQLFREKVAGLKNIYDLDGFIFDNSGIFSAPAAVGGWTDVTAAASPAVIFGSGAPRRWDGNIYGINAGGNENIYGYSLSYLLGSGLSGFIFPALKSGFRRLNEKESAEWLQFMAGLPLPLIAFDPDRFTDEKYRDNLFYTLHFWESIREYIEETVREAARTAEPVIRHMEYQFPKTGFSDCDTQYMLGSKYLIVINPGDRARITVRLPKGNWTDATGKRFKGPLVTDVPAEPGKIIYFEYGK